MREIIFEIAGQVTVAPPLFQHDYGQVWKFTGVTLPAIYEVHFANGEEPGTPSIPATGTAEGGVTVPGEVLASGKYVYAYFFLHNEATDGETIYRIIAPVLKRADLPYIDSPTPEEQEYIAELIVNINAALAAAQAAQTGAETAQGLAAASATEASGYAGAAQRSQLSAALSEQRASNYARDASAAQTGAENARDAAIEAKNAAVDAKDAAVSAKNDAVSAKNDAVLAKNAAEQSSQSAARSKNAAAESARNADGARQLAVAAQGAAESARDDAARHARNADGARLLAVAAKEAAESAATTAGNKAGEASASATTAGEKAGEAAASATAAQTAAAEAGQIVDDAEAWALGAYATSSASGAVATVDDGAEGVPVRELTAYIVPVQEGAGDPSPENVRPIHGYTRMEIARTGKNLCKPKSYLSGSDMYFGGDSLETRMLTLNAGTYTFSVAPSDNAPVALYFMNSGNTQTYASNTSGTAVTCTFAEETQVVLKVYSSRFASGLTIERFQLELGSTATAYEPYTGQTYSVSWEDEAGTVYEGTYDAVTGKLTVTYALIDLGTKTYSYNGSQGFYQTTLDDMYTGYTAASDITDILSDIFAYKGAGVGWQYMSNATYGVYQTSLRLRLDGYESATDFKAAMSGHYMLYPLATPQEYQLDPLDIRTLHGVNNVFANTGDTAVTVRCDPDLHIEKLLAEAVALALENA